MKKTIDNDYNYEYFLIDSIGEGQTKGLRLRIPVESFTDYISSSLEENGNKVLMGTVLPYLKEKNRIIQYTSDPDENKTNSFDEYDCFMAMDRIKTHPSQLILRESKRSATNLFEENPDVWRIPLQISNLRYPDSLFITNGKVNKHCHHLLYFLPVNEKAYNLALLNSRRFSELGERASIEQIKEIVELGTLEPLCENIERIDAKSKSSLAQSQKLLAKIKEL